MAASAWHNAVNTANTTSSYASLPNGSCNFRPLSTGSQAPTCGCRRFWLDKPLDSQNGSSVLCACGHHACFHDVTVDSVPPPSLMRHSSAPSVPSNPDRNTSLLVGPPIEQFGVPPQDKSRHDRTGQLEVAPLSNDVWGRLNNFARWQQDPAWIPSTAPASVLSYEPQTERPSAPSEPSPVKSTTSNERRYASLFPNMDGLMASPTVQGTPTATDHIPDSLQVDVPSKAHHDERETRSTQSESAKPVEPDASDRETEDAKPCLEVTKFVDNKPQETPSTPTKTITPDVHNILQSCVRRLESLETYSFSHVPLDEVQEKFELFDGRLLELEYWKKDIDARLEKSHLALEDKDSQASTSFQDLQTYAGSKALFSRVSEVEDRLADLESAQPSYANPWEIEVVLLPFGRTLQGLWHTSSDTESNQLPSTPAAQCDEDRTSGGLLASTGTKGPAWTADTIEAWASTINPWLWPKAPGPNSNMFKRLQSRGLVRTVSIVDTGAHGIWESVKDAFADFIETQPYHRSNNQQQPYEALKEAFVPLRKIKKSSWLRYLETHELITPATWDISFLDSGVFMNGRGGRKRLYMTTADGYIQPGKTGWTWQQIRDLPRYENLIARSGTLFSREAPSEPFWKHVPALDDAPSFSSFVSQHSNISLGKRRSSNVTFEDHEMESPSAKSYTSSSSGDTITPRYSESFPIIAKRNSDSKRRTSPSCTPVAYQKRRRISGSPSRYRGGLEELTPRWSHEPPTPLVDNIWETRSQCRPGSSRKRLSTPTAYATPHSHNVANVVDLAMADGGDTEVESVGSGAADSEKEWGGLDEDEDDNEQSHQASESSFTDSEWMADNDDSFYQEEGDADDGDSLYEP